MSGFFKLIFSFAVVSATYWLISWLIGLAALGIYAALPPKLKAWFIVMYKVLLNLIFTSVIVATVILHNHPASPPWWQHLIGFLFVWGMMGAVVQDEERGAGYAGNLTYLSTFIATAAYPVFALVPSLLANPFTPIAYGLIAWLNRSWFGVLIAVFALWKIASWFLGAGFLGLIAVAIPVMALRERLVKRKPAA